MLYWQKQIKVRLWNKSKNKWISKEWVVVSNSDELLNPIKECCEVGDDVLVDQFTNTFDKNKQHIFEGDLLKIYGGSLVYVLYYNQDKHTLLCMPYNSESTIEIEFNKVQPELFMIVGNIHEWYDESMYGLIKKWLEKSSEFYRFLDS